MIHCFLKTLHLNLFYAFVGALLRVDAIQDVLSGEDVEDGANCLEMPRLILVKKVWDSPRFERIATPNNQVGALVNLSYSCCTTALHVQVVDIESEVMNDLILSLSFIEIWIHCLGF